MAKTTTDKTMREVTGLINALIRAYDDWADDDEEMTDADLIHEVRVFCEQARPLVAR